MKKIILILLIILFIGLVIFAILFNKTQTPIEEPTPEVLPSDVGIINTIDLNSNWLKSYKDQITELNFVESYSDSAEHATNIGRWPTFFNQGKVFICVPQNTYVLDTLACAFQDFEKLETINGLDRLVFENVTCLNNTFERSGLVELDLSNVDLSNVINAKYTFNDCETLERLHLPHNMNSLRNTEYMLSNCYDLRMLDFNQAVLNLNNAAYMFNEAGTNFACYVMPGFKIASVRNMSHLFYKSRFVDYQFIIDSMDVSNVTDMTSLFEGTNLESIDLSKWNTQNVQIMDRMFAELVTLKNVNMENLSFPNLLSCKEMFGKCSSLQDLKLNWKNISTIHDTSRMFKYCCELQTLDISGFNGIQIVIADEMFYECENLSVIYSEGFITFKDNGIFDYCYAKIIA